MSYADTLNPQQREAVFNTEGPSLVLAGAGSGKTRVLTFRIARLLEQGIDPFRILALTFTNKAAAEMRERIEKVAGTQARSLWMGTFHSIFARILRIESDKMGYPSHFTIYDSTDSKSLLKSIIKERGLDDKIYKANAVASRISSLKNRLISPQEYQRNPAYYEEDIAARRPDFSIIYRVYTERCFRAGAMDFDDLLFNANILFRDHLGVLNKYQQRFQYVLVDEYQDTNLSQYYIIRKLSAVHQNICVVGDDAQSIYGFRGADIQNILNFEKDYPDLKTYKLEQNYRSTKNIVGAANSIIKNNQDQLPKNVFTDNPQGDLIEIIKTSSDGEEARQIANAIFETKVNNDWRHSDFAILYRTNAQSRSLEESLRRINIKYQIIGGLSFYQRKEIKDVVAYLRMVVNPNDEEALKRVINYPKRGIGNTSLAKVIAFSEDQGVPLWEVVKRINEVMTGAAAKRIEQFADVVTAFQIAAEKKNAYDLAAQVAKESGILGELYKDKTVEGISRYENLQELLNAVKEYIDDEENDDKTIGGFLQHVSLLSAVDRDSSDDTDVVTLMTIHMAKGLEYKHVIVSGLEENLFPSMMAMESRADLEEERRLFYVAITRAQRKLTLAYATSRYAYGNLRACQPSRFLEEIDNKFVKVSHKDTPASERKQYSSSDTGGNIFKPPFRRGGSAAQAAARQITHKPTENFVVATIEEMSEGAKVEHQKFGFGKIMKLDLQGNPQRATVEFDKAGEKILVLKFAKLMVHKK